MEGIVKTVTERGFGFVRPNDGDKDIFFHVKDTDQAVPFDDTLLGRAVTFNVIDTEKGKRATDVRLVGT